MGDAQVIGQVLQRMRDTPGGGWSAGDRRISVAEMDESSDRVAAGLLGLGLRRGDRVAVNALTQPEWVEVFFAAAKLGLVVVGLNVRYRRGELDHILNHSRAKALVTLPAVQDVDLLGLVDGLDTPDLQHVISIGDGAPVTLDDLRVDEPAERVPGLSPDDPAMVIYTSGTTGVPKGAVLTHASMLASARAQAEHTRLGAEDVVPLQMPLNHVGGITCGILTGLVGGAHVVLLPTFTPDLVLDTFARHPLTVWSGVPTMHTLLLAHERFADLDTSAVRLVITGGSNAEPALLERLQAGFASATIMNLYGASEASGAAIMSPWESDFTTTVRSIGRPIGDYRLCVLGDDDSEVPAGETGEVCLAGPGVGAGYLDMPDETAATWRDGWLHTGDVGWLDEGGFLTLRGRKKEMFLQGGYNVYPVEVENVLSKHPKVAMCAGVGVPDPVLGEIGRYYVVPAGEPPTDDELRAWCAEHLADYKVPREFVFRDELPLTPVGKIRKAVLVDEVGADVPA